MSTGNISETETTSSNIPERARQLAWLGPPPLFQGEDRAAYDELLTRIFDEVKPADIFEQLWALDIVNLVWELLRLRRMKAALMAATAHEGVLKVLEPFLKSYTLQYELARAWAARDKAATKRVDELLASAGLTIDAVRAQTLCAHLDEFERIERMIAAAEARRDAIHCEVELHRATWGQELRRAAQQAETLEMEVIEDKSGKMRNAT